MTSSFLPEYLGINIELAHFTHFAILREIWLKGNMLNSTNYENVHLAASGSGA